MMSAHSTVIICRQVV